MAWDAWPTCEGLVLNLEVWGLRVYKGCCTVTIIMRIVPVSPLYLRTRRATCEAGPTVCLRADYMQTVPVNCNPMPWRRGRQLVMWKLLTGSWDLVSRL